MDSGLRQNNIIYLKCEQTGAAAYLDGLASDITRFLGSHENDQVAYFLRFAGTAQGHGLVYPLAELRSHFEISAPFDHSEHESIAGNALARTFQCYRLGQADEPRFSGRVAALAKTAHSAGDR